MSSVKLSPFSQFSVKSNSKFYRASFNEVICQARKWISIAQSLSNKSHVQKIRLNKKNENFEFLFPVSRSMNRLTRPRTQLKIILNEQFWKIWCQPSWWIITVISVVSVGLNFTQSIELVAVGNRCKRSVCLLDEVQNHQNWLNFNSLYQFHFISR